MEKHVQCYFELLNIEALKQWIDLLKYSDAVSQLMNHSILYAGMCKFGKRDICSH